MEASTWVAVLSGRSLHHTPDPAPEKAV